MKTRILKATDPVLNADVIDDAASTLRDGGIVVLPTETVYGVGGDATNSLSSKRIYEAKGRPSDNPLIIHIFQPLRSKSNQCTPLPGTDSYILKPHCQHQTVFVSHGGKRNQTQSGNRSHRANRVF